MKQLKRVSNMVNFAVSYTGMVLFIILIVACVTQVFFRFVLNYSLTWTEELARYCFVWMHMIGVSLLIEAKGHATVTVILDTLKGKARKMVDGIIELMILFNGGVMLYSGFLLAYRARTNLSVAMSVPMWLINSSVAVGGLLLIFQAVVQLAILFDDREVKEGEQA
jgi:TRAP-type transport system small permease protein